MTIFKSQRMKITILLLAMLSLAACGGGDTNNGTSATTGLYNGKTSQAVITSSNANKFEKNQAAKAKDNGTPSDTPAKITSKMMLSLQSVGISIPASYQESDCLVSGRKGVETFKNKDTGEITESTTYFQCSDFDGVIEDGYLSSKFLINTSNPKKSTFSAIYKDYSYQDSTEHTITNGDISGLGDISGTVPSTLTLTMELVVEDKILNETLKLEDIKLVLDQGMNQDSYTMTGKIYYAKEGYVTIETPEPVVQVFTDMYPSSGIMRIIGASENEGKNAVIEITYQAGDTYNQKADLDGDGIFEVDQNCNWSQPCEIFPLLN